MIKIKMAVMVAAATAMIAGSASAHEYRVLGQGYSVFTGSYVEPPFAGFENGVDIFPHYDYIGVDGKSHTYYVDTDSGDTFTFTTSEILFSWKALPPILAKKDIPSGTLITNTLVKNGNIPASPITEKFGSGNLAFSQFGPEYQNHFLPAKPGYYGYHIAGTIQVKASNIAGNPNSQGVPGTKTAPPAVKFDQYFICGAGSQDKTDGTSFECVSAPITVPTYD